MALRYVLKKKGVLDTTTDEIITPVETILWRQYEKWLRKKEKDNIEYPKHIFNT
jgi:hypothetical protein